MASRRLRRPERTQRGLIAPAGVDGIETAWSEAAAGRWIDRTRQLALHADRWPAVARVRHRHRGDQRLRIGVLRSLDDRGGPADLHELPKIHDHHAVADA